MTVRVRFAPSPTGHLHVGGARTAIFNWLFARHHGGTFIIRVEDTDQARSTRESEQMVLDDLRWLGILWDEGPDVGGPHAPYRQSERMDLYARVGKELLDRGRAYRCFCSEEELEAKRTKAEVEGRPPHYDLTCFRLPDNELQRRLDAGDRFVVRFHVPKEEGSDFDADVTIDDGIRGQVTWKRDSLGDFIILRSDGMPTYNFCVVVDDHDMRITHVIRAEEHLTNTHRQVLIYRAMGWETPHFAHVSLILGQDRTKLSKRHGATSVSAYAEQGYLAEAMLNYLTLLGWSAPGGEEIFNRDFAVEKFSLQRVNAAPAVFDPDKFLWLNASYLHRKEAAELRPLVLEALGEEWQKTADGEVLRWIDDATDLMKTTVHTTVEFRSAFSIFFQFDPSSAFSDPDVVEMMKEPEAQKVIETIRETLAESAPTTPEEFASFTDTVKKASGAKGKKLFMPMRVALTGSAHGPELARFVPLVERASRLPLPQPVLSLSERLTLIRGARSSAE
jgi:nondiscriminating glutamyl-tRNA synthetase